MSPDESPHGDPQGGGFNAVGFTGTPLVDPAIPARQPVVLSPDMQQRVVPPQPVPPATAKGNALGKTVPCENCSSAGWIYVNAFAVVCPKCEGAGSQVVRATAPS